MVLVSSSRMDEIIHVGRFERKKELSMKVLVCDKISSKGVTKLQEAGFSVDVKTGLPEEELMKTVSPYHVLIVRSATKITKKVIDVAPSLKMIVRGGVGLDNVDG